VCIISRANADGNKSTRKDRGHVMAKTRYRFPDASERAQRMKYGMNLTEIAAALNLSRHTVKDTFHRAMRKLRQNEEFFNLYQLYTKGEA
jgi:DNA-binding NarL/FixJ family response regulator